MRATLRTRCSSSRQRTPSRVPVPQIGTLLYRARMGPLVLFFLLACGGMSESAPSDPSETRVAEYWVGTTDPVDPVRVAVHNERWALPPVSAGPQSDGSNRSELGGSAPAIEPDLRARLSWALLEYRSAFMGRDLEKLESVWSMGAVERLLIKNAWSSCKKIELSFETLAMRVAGSNAVIDFDQELNFHCPNEARTTRSALTASLVLKDDGEWRISKIGDRRGALVRTAQAGPARLAPRSEIDRSDATARRALETLSDYESALQRCDLDGLAHVWIMTDLERQILEGLCFRRGRLELTISEPRVSTKHGRVQIDFTHDLTRQGRGGPAQTRSRLTALLVERADGNLAIWKVRAAE